MVFGVSSSSYLLNSTIQHHLMQFSSLHPDIVAKLLESFYVNDLVCDRNDDDEAYKHYTFARDALNHASFNLRKFITSSHTLRDRMKREGDPCPPKDIGVGASDVTCIMLHCQLKYLINLKRTRY